MRRKNGIAQQIVAALDDAKAAMMSDAQTQKLIGIRLSTLNKMQARAVISKQRGMKRKLAETRAEVKHLREENERLKAELERRAAVPAHREPTEIERVLAAYEATKNGGPN